MIAFGRFLRFISINLALNYIEIYGELFKHKGRAHCIHLHHKGEWHNIEHIAFVQFTILEQVVKQHVFRRHFPVVLEMVHHLSLE